MDFGDKLVTLDELKIVNDRVKPVTEGGTNATTAPAARTNLGAATRIVLIGESTWAAIYSALSVLTNREVASIFIGNTPTGMLTGNVTTAILIGTVSASNTLTGAYDFFCAEANGNTVYNWRVSGLENASSTPTVGTVNVHISDVYSKAETDSTFQQKAISSFNVSSATTFVLAAGARFILAIGDSAANQNGLYMIATTGAGAIVQKDIAAASGITFGTSTANRLTITPTSGTRAVSFIRLSPTGILPSIAT